MKNIDCTLSPKLKLENIGIYALKSFNVLVCEASCDGDIKKLYHKNYSLYLLRILRFMLYRF
jgi:hypothetical protein